MKKIILLVILAFPIMVKAQFSLTINGFVSSKDNSKNYVVFDYDSISKEKLYTNVLKYITYNYKSAKDVVSKVDNEVITINAFQPAQIKAKLTKYDISYTIVVNFKDNKIKIDAPDFKCTNNTRDKLYMLTMSGSNGGFGSVVTIGLYKKNGEPSQKNTIDELELFFNDLCEKIRIAASGENSNEDW